METKKCTRCGVEKSLIEFQSDRHKTHETKNCGPCREYLSKWHREHKEQRLKTQHKYQENNRERLIWLGARHRAKKAGLDFSITESDIHIPERCPLLGIELQFNRGGTGENSPSLDRKDPSLGYVSGNVWIISHKANRIKNNASLNEIKILVKNWEELTNGK